MKGRNCLNKTVQISGAPFELDLVTSCRTLQKNFQFPQLAVKGTQRALSSSFYYSISANHNITR